MSTRNKGRTGARRLAVFILAAAAVYGQTRPIVLKTSTLFDGRGKTLRNTIIVIEGSKIARVGGTVPANAVTYDLTEFTVSPGWIDTHSHLAVHFDNTGRLAGRDEPAPRERGIRGRDAGQDGLPGVQACPD